MNTTPPDILLIVTDDMRDADWHALPRIRQLVADRGTVFPNFFLTTPLCSPSRTSILTGMYAHNHQVLHNTGADGGLAQFQKRSLEAVSLPTRLKSVGYRTALVGKYLNGMAETGNIPGVWDDWMVSTELPYYSPVMNDNGHAHRFGKKYSTDVLRDRAIEIINATEATQPLFLMFSSKAPHGPATPARRDRGAFARRHRERSPDFNEEDVSDKPAYLRQRAKMSEEAIDRDESSRLASLVATDDAVAAILGAMKANGRLGNAYVFVMSDNGWAAGSHRWDSKSLAYNATARVTMAASGPRFARGQTDPRLAANIDIAATIADAAQAQFDRGDGISLLESSTRDAVALESWSVGYMAVRTARHLYIENESGERELYDYDADPYELENLLADWEGHVPAPGAESLAATLKARLDVLKTCVGSTCR